MITKTVTLNIVSRMVGFPAHLSHLDSTSFGAPSAGHQTRAVDHPPEAWSRSGRVVSQGVN